MCRRTNRDNDKPSPLGWCHIGPSLSNPLVHCGVPSNGSGPRHIWSPLAIASTQGTPWLATPAGTGEQSFQGMAYPDTDVELIGGSTYEGAIYTGYSSHQWVKGTSRASSAHSPYCLERLGQRQQLRLHRDRGQPDRNVQQRQHKLAVSCSWRGLTRACPVIRAALYTQQRQRFHLRFSRGRFRLQLLHLHHLP